MKLLINTMLLAIMCHVCQGKANMSSRQIDADSEKMKLRELRTSGKRNGQLGPTTISASDITPVTGCTIYKLDTDESEGLINLLNHLRRRVAKGHEEEGAPGPQPKAADMQRMGYDNELELYALKFASNCNPQYSDSVVPVGFRSIWQGIIYKNAQSQLAPHNMTNVYMELYSRNVKKFNGEDAIGNFSGTNSVTGQDVQNYAILVNHDTRSLGCAIATWRDQSDGLYYRMATCLYGNGLKIGEPLYTSGEPCSFVHQRDCDDGLIIQESGLSIIDSLDDKRDPDREIERDPDCSKCKAAAQDPVVQPINSYAPAVSAVVNL